MTNAQLCGVAPEDLSKARLTAHRAVQHLTKAARANLPAQSDDSQSNLGWNSTRQSFLSHPINGVSIGLSLKPFVLFFLDQNGSKTDLPLNGVNDAEAAAWLNSQLSGMGLNKASDITLPYEMSPEAAAIKVYPASGGQDELRTLTAWFDIAHQTLTRFAEANKHLRPGPSAVRCWPHHFDIATYVSLESGDPESARGIGVGLSPGDENYAEPYLYINPWPHLNATALPEPAAPGHWHTEGYVSLIATVSRLCAAETPSQAIANFVEEGFATALAAQGFHDSSTRLS